MARKRERLNLRKLSKASPEYWEEILRREGLGESAGISKHLSYEGGTTELDILSMPLTNHTASKRKDE